MLNPVQQRIADGMKPLAAFLTEHTCGEACWEAREDICRCACHGRNHGCMRTADGVRPERTARIDATHYSLKGISADYYNQSVYADASRINESVPYPVTGPYKWSETEKGAPARVKPATKGQLARWPELAGFRQAIDAVRGPGHAPVEWMKIWPYLLWLREDLVEK